jgi:hypothetical protein
LTDCSILYVQKKSGEIREYLEMQKLDSDVEGDPKNQRFTNKEVHSIQDFPQELDMERKEEKTLSAVRERESNIHT